MQPNDPNNPGSPSNPPPPKITRNLLKKLLEEDTQEYFKEDCPDCGESDCFVEIPDYLYEIPEHKISEEMAVWVCSSCGYEAFEEESLEKVLNLQEKIEGRPYRKVELKDGKKTIRTIH